MWKVKRMNTARIVVLIAADGVGGIAAYRANRSGRTLPPTLTQPPRSPAQSTRAAGRGRTDLTTDQVTERTPVMKCRENQRTMRAFMVRALSFSAVVALTINPALTPVFASDSRTTRRRSSPTDK